MLAKLGEIPTDIYEKAVKNALDKMPEFLKEDYKEHWKLKEDENRIVIELTERGIQLSFHNNNTETAIWEIELDQNPFTEQLIEELQKMGVLNPKRMLKEIGFSNENIYSSIEKAFEKLINEAIENISETEKEINMAGNDLFEIIKAILIAKEYSGINVTLELDKENKEAFITLSYLFLYEPTREFIAQQIVEAIELLLKKSNFFNNVDQEDIYNHAFTLLRDYETYMGKDFFLILYEELKRTKPDFFDIDTDTIGIYLISTMVFEDVDINIEEFINNTIKEEKIIVKRIYNAGKMLYAKNTPFYTIEFYLENEGVTKKLIQIKEWAYYDSFDIYNSIIKKLRKLDKALLQKIKDYIGTNRAVFKFDSFGAFTHSTYSFIVTFKRIY